jgi:hypothetical protein
MEYEFWYVGAAQSQVDSQVQIDRTRDWIRIPSVFAPFMKSRFISLEISA